MRWVDGKDEPSLCHHGSGRSPANQAAAKTNATKMITCCPVTSNWGLSLTALRLRFQPCLAYGSSNGSPFFQVRGLSPLSRLLPIDNVKSVYPTTTLIPVSTQRGLHLKLRLASGSKTLASRVFVRLDARAAFWLRQRLDCSKRLTANSRCSVLHRCGAGEAAPACETPS